MLGLIGKKIGMSQLFDEMGEMIPVTVIQAGPNFVTQVKTEDKEGYNAVQLGFDVTRGKLINQPVTGHLKKANVEPVKVLKEFRLQDDEIQDLELGKALKPGDVFQIGDMIKVSGKMKGRGFTGVMKRHNFGGGRDSHGAKYHRKPFSIGMHTDPGRVFKNKKMPGHYGDSVVTQRGLMVVGVDDDKNFLIVRGSIPGAKNSYVYIKKDQ